MCGRYALTSSADVLAELFSLEPAMTLAPRYNIAPTQDAPVLRCRRDGSRSFDLLRWGLVPWWAKDLSVGARAINARCETLTKRAMFRDAVRERRCLVPADGFFEWKSTPGGKQPYYVTRTDGRPMVFAGLWERWRDDAGDAVRTYTIITTPPNDTLAPLHDRMPAILEPEQFDAWLDPEVTDTERVLPLLRPHPDGLVDLRPVSRRVNNVANDDPACLAAPEPGGEQGALF